MEHLQKHKFYVALGGVLLLYLLLYYFLVSPVEGELKVYTRKLQSAKGFITKQQQSHQTGFPSKETIAFYQSQKKVLEANLSAIHKYFESKDAILEKWFEGLTIYEGTQMPVLTEFHSHYRDRSRLLFEECNRLDYGEGSKVRVIDDSGKPVEEILPLEKSLSRISTLQAMRTKQKEFWIIQGILELAALGRLKELSFFAPIKYNYIPRREDSKDGKYDPFLYHQAEFKGKIEYSDVPFLIESLLKGRISGKNPEQPEEFMIELLKIDVDRKEVKEIETMAVPIEHDEEDVPGALRRWKEEHREELEKNLYPVTVTVRCKILDYEPTVEAKQP